MEICDRKVLLSVWLQLLTDANPFSFSRCVCVWTNDHYAIFQIPVTYPTTAPEIALPELDGKTAKMYRYMHLQSVSANTILRLLCCRGGRICLTDHFKPLWARNVPKFGIGHAMALGVSYECEACV